MLVIGLTGGIGSGKTTVANYFAELGAPIIDADIIARELVQPGKPALQAITEHFGNSVLNDDTSLARDQLRRLVFNNPQERRWLEQLLHPLIRQEMRALLHQVNFPYCILIIPLLIETDLEFGVDRILVVDTPETQQIARVKTRSGMTEEEIIAVIHAQSERQYRLSQAHDIIHNDEGFDKLKQQVQQLHQQYMKLEAQKG